MAHGRSGSSSTKGGRAWFSPHALEYPIQNIWHESNPYYVYNEWVLKTNSKNSGNFPAAITKIEFEFFGRSFSDFGLSSKIVNNSFILTSIVYKTFCKATWMTTGSHFLFSKTWQPIAWDLRGLWPQMRYQKYQGTSTWKVKQ